MSEQQDQDVKDRILATIEAEHVRFVNLEFTDVVGMAKCVTIPVEQFPDCLTHGKWFDGSSLESFARVAESDMYLFPDLDTFAILPTGVRPETLSQTAHEESTGQGASDDVVARVICNVRTPDGEPFDGDPRATLMRALDVARSMGYSFRAAPELEFFLLLFENNTPAPLPHDRGGYFDLSTDLAAAARRQMARTLQQMGMMLDTRHHHITSGQHQLTLHITHRLHTPLALYTAHY